VGLRGWLKRLQKAADGTLGSFELVDGSSHFYDPQKVLEELFLFGMDCARADSLEDWPEPPPEVYQKLTEAKDPAGVLERFVPSDKATWFIELPYDREALIHERRLVPVEHEPLEDLSEP
jgi:hypothetical protein